MILGHVPLHDLHLMFRANIPDQVPDAGSHFPAQRRTPVFRYPNQMQMDLENGVRAPSVIRHPSSLSGARSLKPSPERRGLQPSQTGTVMQVNVQIPAGVQPGGYVSVVLTVGSASNVAGAAWIAVAGN
jgi:hypothetical protein